MYIRIHSIGCQHLLSEDEWNWLQSKIKEPLPVYSMTFMKGEPTPCYISVYCDSDYVASFIALNVESNKVKYTLESVSGCRCPVFHRVVRKLMV